MTGRGAAGLLIGAAAAAACSGCGSTHRAARPQPSWVRDGVQAIRREFVGQPQPVRVTWGVGAPKRWVSVLFARTTICGGCSWPANAHPVQGRRATMWFEVRDGRETDFGVTRR